VRPASLLAYLRSLGHRVGEEDGRLFVEGEAPEEALAAARASRSELLDLLRLEAERVAPCPCGSCKEPGALQHGPCCYCGPCIALDPELDVWRERADAEQAAAKADAAYEAEERLAIQEEGCTAEELAALRAKQASEAATVAAGPDAADVIPPPGEGVRSSWSDPDLDAEDRGLLEAIKRLDREGTTGTAAASCYACGGSDWWRSRHGGHLVCRRCHPPAPGAEATQAAGAKECA
jgi:hypothetical protein